MAVNSHCTNCGICRRVVHLFITTIACVCFFSSEYEVSGVRMVTHQLNMTFEMGRDATLTCSVRNIGKKRVIWRKLSDPFPLAVGTTRFWPTSKYRVRRNGEDWQLIIRNVQYHDAGEYECRLTGRDDIADILSLIIPGSDHTHFLPTETTVTASVGSTVILPCHVNNLRKALVLWQKEDGRVVTLRKKTHSGDKRHKVLHKRRPEWSLQIRNVKAEDMGVYMCVVNTNPPLTRTVTLQEGKPQKPGMGNDKIPETGQSTSGSPQLVRETFVNELDVKQYQTFVLICQFTGDPIPTIKWERRIWSRHGEKVVEDLKTLGEKYTLTNAQPEDTGIYVCKASNGMPPPEQAKIRVKVTEVITTTTPIPTTTPFDPIYEVAPRAYATEEVVYQRLGRDAELACKGVGIPRPEITWMVDGNHIQNDYKYEIRTDTYRHHTRFSTLQVRSVHPGNFRKYVCRVSNRLGDDRTAIVLAQLRG